MKRSIKTTIYTLKQQHNKFLNRCLQLASLGLGKTKTNPMVGCVIVFQNKILAEGYHKFYGGAHAELEAISVVKDIEKLKSSTLYVSLEPCYHYGKQPPCVDAILKYRIPKVVVLNLDPNPRTAGKSIAKLKKHGVIVKQCSDKKLLDRANALNRRFFTNMLSKRPYLILKYAQTQDGFIAPFDHKGVYRISGEISHRWVHVLRSQESACLVGKNTAVKDAPRLDTRYWAGSSPKKIILCDEKSPLNSSTLQKESEKVFVFSTGQESSKSTKIKHFKITQKNWKEVVFKTCLSNEISSIIVEGGAITLHSFLEENLWDEIWVFTNKKKLSQGIKAPRLSSFPKRKIYIDRSDTLSWYQNEMRF